MLEIPNAPQQDRLDFIRYTAATQDLQQARDVLNHLDFLYAEGKSKELMHSIWVSFFVLYGRPFKQRKPLKIEDDLIPDELRSEHDTIIKYRDKFAAHTDLNGPKMPDGGNIFGLFIQAQNNNLQPVIRTVRALEGASQSYRKLIDEIIKKTSYRAGKVINKYIKKMSLPENSKWQINIGESEDVFLLKYTPNNSTEESQ